MIMSVEWIRLLNLGPRLPHSTRVGVQLLGSPACGRVIVGGRSRIGCRGTSMAADHVTVNKSSSLAGCLPNGLVLPAALDHVDKAAIALNDSQVIAVPTDTLYGFACDACSETAVLKLYEIKGRSATRPLAICVAESGEIERYGTVSHLPQGLLGALFPGPVTLILPRDDSSLLGKALNPGLDSVGVRVPDDLFIRSLCRAVGRPLALTSANLSSQPSTISVQEFRHLWAHCSFVFDAGVLPAGRAGSTIVDLTQAGTFKIVRDGSALGQTRDALCRFGLSEMEN